MDEQLKVIIGKMESMFIDMETHDWQRESEIYGGITFGEFQRILHELHELSGQDYDDYDWTTEDE